MARPMLGSSKMTRILIDAGHGGQSRAGSSSAYGSRGSTGLLEKDVTLDIARHVVARLGGAAALTRDGDTNLTLGARAQRAARGGADVFVSIHANSGPPEMSGPETWVHPDAGASSHALAGGIQRALDRLAGRYGGAAGSVDSRRGPMAVLSPQAVGRRTAACLVEVDYLTSPRGERRLGDPGERAAIGAAIAGAIAEHLHAGGGGGVLGRPGLSHALAEITPDPAEYSGGFLDFVRVWAAWFARAASWRAGVPSSAYGTFPHTAICELEMSFSDGNTYWGTGFFIGPEKILSCGHNFYDEGHHATSVIVRPGKRPHMSVAGHRVNIPDWRQLVHPRWAASYDRDFDMSVLRTPGLSAPGGRVFPLPTMTPAGNQQIVVCGYGKRDDAGPYSGQGQYLDGSHITRATDERFFYPIQTVGGHSGSPVFWPAEDGMVVGIHVAARNEHENQGVRLTPAKTDWINSK
jgi:N-acetylmuramoyl-L-alanine amidase/V8-like Glu-specific endopeptidase